MNHIAFKHVINKTLKKAQVFSGFGSTPLILILCPWPSKLQCHILTHWNFANGIQFEINDLRTLSVPDEANSMLSIRIHGIAMIPLQLQANWISSSLVLHRSDEICLVRIVWPWQNICSFELWDVCFLNPSSDWPSKNIFGPWWAQVNLLHPQQLLQS